MNLLIPSDDEVRKERLKYYHDVLFFLSFGESAPCKSIEEAMNLPIDVRDEIAKRLAEAYREQKEQMEESQRKAGGRRGKTMRRSY